MKPLKVFSFILAGLAAWITYRFLKRKALYDHRFGSRFAKRFYNYFHGLRQAAHICVSNYGYAPVDKYMSRYDSWHQHGLQLYRELVTGPSGILVPPGSRIVEIGCGKGAGALFLRDYCRPVQYTGIDYSRVAIDFCKEAYRGVEGLRFRCADAADTGLPDRSADVVLSVESSHVYRDFEQFLLEVKRILRPGGLFLLADYRWIAQTPLASLEKQFQAAGFETLGWRDISAHVQKACRETTGLRKKLIRENLPWYLRPYFGHYAMLQGSRKLALLARGDMVYFMYQLKNTGVPGGIRKERKEERRVPALAE